ncbi:uncharacterized protein [Rutidosis leptorrhynchoides]|uniref:uncharacterized protein n=1 Tax=Rutidosis leptorrhynchoides TaxID=125765 RepID=UPI003A997872
MNNTFGGSIGRGRHFSTTEFSNKNNKIVEPLKVKEAEIVNTPPPLTEKEHLKIIDNLPIRLLTFHFMCNFHAVVQYASELYVYLAYMYCRSSKSSIQDSWANQVSWHQVDLFSSDSWKESLDEVTSVISCVGGFGSNAQMYKINGTANINALRVASERYFLQQFLIVKGPFLLTLKVVAVLGLMS